MIVMLLLAMSASACGVRPETAVAAAPDRIVSMSPAVTETLFALGVGDRVVGVTRFCFEPEAARSLPKVGGYLDPNWEAIVALEPDLVIGMESQGEMERRLGALGIPVVRVDQHRLTGILDSFELLGRVCGVPDRGKELRRTVEGQLENIREAVRGLPEPRVLLSVGRRVGGGRITSLWTAGPGTFLNDVLAEAGGVNVVTGSMAGAYPELTVEGIVELDPDVILDLVPEGEDDHGMIESARNDWKNLDVVRAVSSGRVEVLSGRFLSIPGPRVAEIVEVFARALHPEVRWE